LDEVLNQVMKKETNRFCRKSNQVFSVSNLPNLQNSRLMKPNTFSYKIFLTLCLFYFCGYNLIAQTLKGRLLDNQNKEPIVGASVFFANTSIGTISDEKGGFEIKKIPQNSVELVISLIGYETFVMPLLIDTLRNRSLTILLREKADEIEAITVTAKNTVWKYNYETFKRFFIGETENARHCKIRNPEILNFNYQNRVFKAAAKDFLVIENKKLGYVLKYKLADFMIDFSDSRFIISGYPFFEPMTGTARQQKLWEKARFNAYKGSALHFIRCLYHSTWEKEGFVIKKLVRRENTQRPSDSLIKQKIQRFINEKQRDSLDFWIGKSKMSKIVQELYDVPIRANDSLVIHYASNPSLKKLGFKDCLQVSYTKEKPSYLYPYAYEKEQISVLVFNKPYILLQEDGYVIENLDISYEGYMPWKKMADLLPLDYQVPKK